MWSSKKLAQLSEDLKHAEQAIKFVQEERIDKIQQVIDADDPIATAKQLFYGGQTLNWVNDIVQHSNYSPTALVFLRECWCEVNNMNRKTARKLRVQIAELVSGKE